MIRTAVPTSLVTGDLIADVIVRDGAPSIRVTDTYGYLIGYFDTAEELEQRGLTPLIIEIRHGGGKPHDHHPAEVHARRRADRAKH